MNIEIKIALCFLFLWLAVNIGLYLFSKFIFKRVFIFQIGLLFSFFIVETVISKLENNSSSISHVFDGGLYRVDYFFGHVPVAKSSVNHTVYYEDSITCEYNYTLDQHGHRSNRQFSKDKSYDLGIFGQKEVFGLGLHIDSTLTECIARSNPVVLAQNRAYIHQDLNYFLAIMDSLKPYLAHKRIYYFISKSALEAINYSFDYINQRGAKAPYYQIQSRSHSIIRRSNGLEGNSVRVGLSILLGRSYLINKIGLDWEGQKEKYDKLLIAMNYAIEKSNGSLCFVFIDEKNSKWKQSDLAMIKSQIKPSNYLDCTSIDFYRDKAKFAKLCAIAILKNFQKHSNK